jgi:hypothetical protein
MKQTKAKGDNLYRFDIVIKYTAITPTIKRPEKYTYRHIFILIKLTF